MSVLRGMLLFEIEDKTKSFIEDKSDHHKNELSPNMCSPT